MKRDHSRLSIRVTHVTTRGFHKPPLCTFPRTQSLFHQGVRSTNPETLSGHLHVVVCYTFLPSFSLHLSSQQGWRKMNEHVQWVCGCVEHRKIHAVRHQHVQPLKSAQSSFSTVAKLKAKLDVMSRLGPVASASRPAMTLRRSLRTTSVSRQLPWKIQPHELCEIKKSTAKFSQLPAPAVVLFRHFNSGHPRCIGMQVGARIQLHAMSDYTSRHRHRPSGERFSTSPSALQASR